MISSLKAYDKKYQQGYGVVYPDGHIIRFYERILKYKLNKTSGNMLDFGCGNGVHCAYFKSKGFKPFGIDIIPSIKENWKKLSLGGGDLHIIEPNSSFKHLFQEKMDLIFANQSLYYIPSKQLQNTINDFYDLSNDGAIFFASMMSTKNGYYKHSIKQENTDLRKVVLNARLKEESYINFIEKAQDMIALFKPFKTLYLGEYDPINIFDFEDEGSAHHFIYIGIKE
ncbi:class I SAM-dependent methyltransferase [Campylobacter armoricus]|uniref:class I SAM-dependent methyltransferase n=1 Tax=Campylobacter armoricus TaxID=2505970 RepID=UPI001116D574|nr:methyltransferase domain-containing protein [Campylobacter armoricus]